MKQIRTDFQGWPVNALTLKEIFEILGLKIDDNNGSISGYIDEKLLNSYPKVFEDDGMAYGVNPRFVSVIDSNCTYLDEELNETVFNIFAEPYIKNDISNN